MCPQRLAKAEPLGDRDGAVVDVGGEFVAVAEQFLAALGQLFESWAANGLRHAAGLWRVVTRDAVRPPCNQAHESSPHIRCVIASLGSAFTRDRRRRPCARLEYEASASVAAPNNAERAPPLPRLAVNGPPNAAPTGVATRSRRGRRRWLEQGERYPAARCAQMDTRAREPVGVLVATVGV